MNTASIEVGFRSLLQILSAVVREKDRDKIVDYSKLIGDMLLFYRKYWGLQVDSVYQDMLRVLEEPADRVMAAALEAESRQMPDAAFCLAEAATATRGQICGDVSVAGFLRKNGKIRQAKEICTVLSGQRPDDQNILSEYFMCSVAELFWSMDYYDLLAEIHAAFTPKVYLEIGVATGKSLALARAATRALGVDPASAEKERLIYHSPHNDPQLYKMTSDDLFASHDMTKEMGQSYFNVAFIDGLHHFDQVLRDFINVEKYAAPDSVVLVHDCLPVDPRVATRERSTAFWTGDVWKIVPCLKAVRPDLEIVTLPLAPSGLALIRHLDPSSSVLARQYVNIVEQFDSLQLPESWDERCNLLAVERDESRFSIADYIPKGGWP